MNNNRRSRLATCASKLSTLILFVESVKEAIDTLCNLKEKLDIWSNYVDTILTSLEGIEEEEQKALDSIPDNLQLGDIASSIELSLSLMSEAIKSTNTLKDFIDGLEDSYLKTFLPGFNPEEVLDKLDGLIESIEVARDDVEEAKS